MTNTGFLLQRVIFPEHGDPQSLPLYLDPEDWGWNYIPDTREDSIAKSRGVFTHGHNRIAARLTNRNGLAWLKGRRGIEVPADHNVSFASYFNAFPASYWRVWTGLEKVILRLELRGKGRAIIYRSNARGVIQRVDGREVEGESTVEFEVPLKFFVDGGWLWFDLVTGEDKLELVQGDWYAPEGFEPRVNGTATVSITTLNRGDYLTELLAEIGGDKEVLSLLDRVQVVDQGSEKLVEHAAYPQAVEALEGKLHVIEQANLGGSGGFARGMYETVKADVSDYVILLDDDVEIEPESLRRALVFANFATAPTIVGGHMFDMYDKTKLHAFAEGIHWDAFQWGPFTPGRHDLGDSNLRQTTWLHRRFDVDYNGWWMSLIPVEVIKEIGLSLPYFIKWDDAEYSLRARKAGYPTVSLPGAAVWHVSWVDKDDSHDWQAYFHARNRLVTALIYSPEHKGGLVRRGNLAVDMKNLLTMDYYTVEMRLQAIENVLQGPGQLHDDIVDRLPKVRALGTQFTESTVERKLENLPHFPARVIGSVATGVSDPGPYGNRLWTWLARVGLRHALAPVSPEAKAEPELHLAFQDARWFETPNYDSVLVSNAEGSGVSWHLRNPRHFREMVLRSVRLNNAVYQQWDELRQQYLAALSQITSMERWEETFRKTGSL